MRSNDTLASWRETTVMLCALGCGPWGRSWLSGGGRYVRARCCLSPKAWAVSREGEEELDGKEYRRRWRRMHNLHGRAGFGRELVFMRVNFGRSRLQLWHCPVYLPLLNTPASDPVIAGGGSPGGPVSHSLHGWQPGPSLGIEAGGRRNTFLLSLLSPLGWRGRRPSWKQATHQSKANKAANYSLFFTKEMGLGAGGEGCSGSVSLTGSSAWAPGHAQGLVSSVGRGRRRGTPGNIPED